MLQSSWVILAVNKGFVTFEFVSKYNTVLATRRVDKMFAWPRPKSIWNTFRSFGNLDQLEKRETEVNYGKTFIHIHINIVLVTKG